MSTDPTDMKPIGDFAALQLQWDESPEVKQRYDLRTGDELLATLAFERRTLANAECAAGRWTFKREGFWRPQVTIREIGSESNLAVFRPHLGGGGELSAGDGEPYHFKSANFWSTEWIWQHQDRTLVAYKRGDGFGMKAGVDIAPEARQLPQLSLLVVLGWYLMVLFAQDVAVQSGAAAASGARIVVMHP